jgi:hypothetical protein
MNSVNRNFGCGLVSTWEEHIWLDRRELACQTSPARRGIFVRFGAWLQRVCTRMQLGPVCGDWSGDPDRPF